MEDNLTSSSSMPSEVIHSLVCVEIFIAIATVFGSALILITYADSSEVRSQPSNILILGIATYDMMTAVLALPISIHKRLLPSFWAHPARCVAGTFLHVLPMACSYIMFAALSLERFVFIRFPIKHKVYIQKSYNVYIVYWTCSGTVCICRCCGGKLFRRRLLGTTTQADSNRTVQRQEHFAGPGHAFWGDYLSPKFGSDTGLQYLRVGRGVQTQATDQPDGNHPSTNHSGGKRPGNQ